MSKITNLYAGKKGCLSYYSSDYRDEEIIINKNYLINILYHLANREKIRLEMTPEIVKFLNNSLREYLKNIIQQLIENNRRRTYSDFFSFSKQNKIVSYRINVQRDGNPIINSKKNKLFPEKTLKLICSINVDKKLNLLNDYYMLNKKRKNNDIIDIKEKSKKNLIKIKLGKDGKDSEDNSESSDYNFFNKEKKAESNEEINDNNKNNIQGVMNVYQSHELTTNKLIHFKNYTMKNIELKDLLFYLEENQTHNKKILFKVYNELLLKDANKTELNTKNKIPNEDKSN